MTLPWGVTIIIWLLGGDKPLRVATLFETIWPDLKLVISILETGAGVGMERVGET